MGRQIGFYMLPEDEKEFLEFVQSDDNVIIVPSLTKNLPPEKILHLPKPFSTLHWNIFYFLNKRFAKEAQYNFIEKTQSYYIDFIKSPVIEFSRSWPKGNKLNEGRLWIETSYWNKNLFGKDVVVKKPEAFTKWYEKIIKWIKKNYVKTSSLYLSKRTLTWLKLGGKLCISGQEIGYDLLKNSFITTKRNL